MNFTNYYGQLADIVPGYRHENLVFVFLEWETKCHL
jgi:hypothetical protein